MQHASTTPSVDLPGGGVCLVTALCDPEAELLNKAELLWPKLKLHFDAVAVQITDDTHPAWYRFLEENAVSGAGAPPAWDEIGLHRRRALGVGLNHFNHDRLLYADPDHILRWIERQSDELTQVLKLVGRWDLMMAARGFSRRAAQ